LISLVFRWFEVKTTTLVPAVAAGYSIFFASSRASLIFFTPKDVVAHGKNDGYGYVVFPEKLGEGSENIWDAFCTIRVIMWVTTY
jgi:hypothetical protein